MASKYAYLQGDTADQYHFCIQFIRVFCQPDRRCHIFLQRWSPVWVPSFLHNQKAAVHRKIIPSDASNYYQLWAEVFFGFWRTYSMLDLNISRDGVTMLAPPRRIIFPRITRETFDNKGGLGAYIYRAAFPSMGLEFADTWADRNETNRPFLLERVVIGDRVAAEHASEWPGLYKYAAPAFTLPGSPQDAWWAPIRRGLIQFLDQYDTQSESAKGKVVVTYISRQRSTRRKLHSGDHVALIKALETLHRRYNYEVNVVNMEELSKKDQLSLAARTTVGVSLALSLAGY
jgi:hypothetical protein